MPHSSVSIIFFFVILGTQQSLIAAHEALQERWEATKKNASAIGKELQMKASRWAVVEPVAMKIEKKLNIISRYIEREQNSKEKFNNDFQNLLYKPLYVIYHSFFIIPKIFLYNRT